MATPRYSVTLSPSATLPIGTEPLRAEGRAGSTKCSEESPDRRSGDSYVIPPSAGLLRMTDKSSDYKSLIIYVSRNLYPIFL